MAASVPGSARGATRPAPGVPRTARSRIDYALARRATLADLFSGRRSSMDVCDAHPYLVRAARYYGTPTPDTCPVCRAVRLTAVTYVYGDELGDASGRACKASEVLRLEAHYAELTVYVVEVCAGCSWNHLRTSFVVGTGSGEVSTT